jgi:hypothetical protein
MGAARALHAYTAIEIKLLLSYFRAELAQSYHRTGDLELALTAVDGALSIADQTAEHF